MTDIQKLIQKEKDFIEKAPPTDVDVELGGDILTIGVRPLIGSDWVAVCMQVPPRSGVTLDAALGFNVEAVARRYKPERLTVNGAEFEYDDDWTELYDALASPHRKNIATAMWGVNVYDPEQRLIARLKERDAAKEDQS